MVHDRCKLILSLVLLLVVVLLIILLIMTILQCDVLIKHFSASFRDPTVCLWVSFKDANMMFLMQVQ